MTPIQNAGLFLTMVLFNTYIFILLLRIVLQKFRVDFYHPLSQWVLKMTNPPLTPLRRYLRPYAGLDLAACCLLLVLQLVKFSLVVLLESGLIPNVTGLLIVALADTFAQVINLFFYAMLFMVLLSWMNPGAFGPMAGILSRLTEPMIRPVRRFIPPIGGIDLTPVPVMIGLKLMIILLVDPLLYLGKGLL